MKMSGDGERGDGRGELDEEMAFHLDRLTADLEEEGWSPREARREAVRRFGNPERVQEEVRRARGHAWGDEVTRNLRFALRALRRSPVHAAATLLTTALTVAFGALAWGAGDAALWQSLPWPEPDRLMLVSMFDRALAEEPQGGGAVDGATWEAYRGSGVELPAAVFSGWSTGVNMTAEGTAAFVQNQRVGAGWFSVLGVRPWRGREFDPADDVPQGPAVAILTWELWSRAFGADPSLLGGTIRLKGEPHTVVGILPEGFRSPWGAEVFTPLRPSTTGEGSGTNYQILARLPAGMSTETAATRLASVSPDEAWAARDGDWRFGVFALDRALRRSVETPMRLLLGGIALMLVIGWSNLAGMQVARMISRRGELATRTALGGGPGVLARQIAVEVGVVGLLGGALGLAAVWALIGPVEAHLASRFGVWQPLPSGIPMALRVGAMTLLALATSGLWPVARAAAAGRSRLVVSGSRIRGPERALGRKLLLVGQLAMVTMLTFSAGLLARSYGQLDGIERGFVAEGVHTVQLSLNDARFSEAPAVRELVRTTLERLDQRPEVTHSAVALTLPYERPLNMGLRHPGEEDWLLTNVVYVTPSFFETLGIPLLQGRLLDRSDGPESARVVVANQAFVERYLADRGPPVGARLAFGSSDMGEVDVVGVVGDVQQSVSWGGVSDPVWRSPTVYLAVDQLPTSFFSVHVWFSPSWLVRGRTLDGLPETTQAVFSEVVPDLALARSLSLEEVVDRRFARQRLEAGFLSTLSLFAILLAGIGLYGLVAQQVLERLGEMGIRIALGASPNRAVLHAGGSGAWLGVAGGVLGLAGCVLAARLLESLIWGLDVWDPVTLALLPIVVGGVTAVASFVPAMRVGRLDPAKVLREG